jgi:hypothetical protein
MHALTPQAILMVARLAIEVAASPELVFRLAHDWIYGLHGQWFPMPVEQFNAIHYGAMAIYKIGVLLFNLVPYLALLIAGRTVRK